MKKLVKPMTTSNLGSVPVSERSIAPDLARGFMLLLIVLAHAPLLLFGSEPGVLTRPEGVTIWDRIIDFVALLFIDNRAYPMFAALFGYGMVMLVTRQLAAGTSEVEAKRLLRRRALFLLLFGFVHIVIIGGADVLTFYGMAGLLFGWLLFRKDRALAQAVIIVGLIYLILLPLLWTGTAYVMGGVGQDSNIYATDTYAYITLINLLNAPFVPLIQMFLFPMLVPILVGMWAARKKLLEEPKQNHKIFKRMALIGIPISVIGGFPLALVGAQFWAPVPLAEGPLAALNILTGLAGGFGYAAVFGLIGAKISKQPGAFARSLAALGKRSLTFYLLLEALLVMILSPVGFGLGGSLSSLGGAIVAILIWLVALGLAPYLEHKGLRGPAEALLRKLVYSNKHQRTRGNHSEKTEVPLNQ